MKTRVKDEIKTCIALQMEKFIKKINLEIEIIFLIKKLGRDYQSLRIQYQMIIIVMLLIKI
jgi:hypothetical protein